MLGTLRFRLPALFLAACSSFGLVSSRSRCASSRTTRDSSGRELAREAAGLADLYAESALRSSTRARRRPRSRREKLELATGDELFYVGASLFPGQRFGLTRLPRERARRRRARARRPGASFEFTPPGETAAPRGRAAGAARRGRAVRLARRREAGGRAPRAVADAPRAARARARRRGRARRAAVLVALAAADGAGARAHARDRRGRAPAATTSSSRIRTAATRSRCSASASADGRRSSPRPRSSSGPSSCRVSHELRTPLTAIRGHVEALREGIVAEPEQVRELARGDRAPRPTGSSGSSETCSTSRSSQAHRFTVRHEEVDLGRAPRQRTTRSPRRRAAARSTTRLGRRAPLR